MKGNKSHPRNYEAIACYLMRRLERTQKRADAAEAREKIKDAEIEQLKAMLERITKDQIASLRKIQAELYK